MIDRVTFTENKYAPYFAFWKQYLSSHADEFDFRTLANGSPSGARSFAALDFTLPADAAPVSNRAGENEQAFFVIVLTAFAVLLHKYTGAEGVVIDTPLYGQVPAPEGYADKVPIILRPGDDQTLKALLEACRQTVQQAYKFQHYPVDLLVGNAGGRTNVALRYDKLHGPLAKSEAYDLVVEMGRKGNALHVTLRYNPGAFTPSFVERIPGHLGRVLGYLKDSAGTPAREIDILGEAEQEALRKWGQGPVVERTGQTLQGLFEMQVQRSPQAVALSHPGGQLTYQELNAKANQLAAYLLGQPDWQAGQVVGVLLERGPWQVIAVLAILKAGGAYLPVDVAYPPERRRFMLTDAGVRLVLTTCDHLFNLEGYHGALFAFDLQFDALPPHADNPPSGEGRGDALAYVLYTSGSTGQPKGVMVGHGGVLNLVLSQIDCFGITAHDKVLQFAALTFDASVSEIGMALGSGATLVLADEDVLHQPQALLAWMRQQRVSVVTLPPSYLSLLSGPQLAFLRVLITAGEAARPGDAYACSPYLEYYNAYGPTECSVCVTVCRLAAVEGHQPVAAGSLPIGRPLPNTQVYLLDGQGQRVAMGVSGEIWVGGAGLAQGYLGRPQLTRERFGEQPWLAGERLYRTGDLGRWREDGQLEYLGRADNQVKVRGYRVEPGEVEAALLAHPQLQEAVVLARPDPQGLYQLVAYTVSRNDALVNAQALRTFLLERLPEYLVPSLYQPLAAIPLTPHGKVDRHALLARQVTTSEQTYTAPRNAVEADLARIWEQVLGMAPIGIDDNFFEIGGHSLQLIRLHASLQEQYKDTFKIATLFDQNTIARQARLVSPTAPSPVAPGYAENIIAF